MSLVIQYYVWLYSFRDSIEHIYPNQVAQLRNEYKPEDKELIKEFVLVKCTQATESVQEAIISDQGDIEELKQGNRMLCIDG